MNYKISLHLFCFGNDEENGIPANNEIFQRLGSIYLGQRHSWIPCIFLGHINHPGSWIHHIGTAKETIIQRAKSHPVGSINHGSTVESFEGRRGKEVCKIKLPGREKKPGSTHAQAQKQRPRWGKECVQRKKGKGVY